MDPVGLLQATIDSIGEGDNEIGGLAQTRVATAASSGIALPDVFSWISVNRIYTYTDPATLGVVVEDYLRLGPEGIPFKVTLITYNGTLFRYTLYLETTRTSPESLDYSLPNNATWNGTTTVSTVDPDYVTVGSWVYASGSGILYNWFKIINIQGFLLTIENPWGLPIPSGSFPTRVGTEPRTYEVPTSLSVETVVESGVSGQIAVDGILYNYGSRTLSPPSFDDLAYTVFGQTYYGIKRAHTVGTVVTDRTQARSELEQVRRAMLVDYATGESLNVLGRNHGVLRYPFLADDEIFREIVKALSYNPRGTMYGLELAMDALVGSGNYVLYEDLINHNNTVFIALTGAAALTAEYKGKAFLTGKEHLDPDSTTQITLNGTVITLGSVHSVRLKTENHLTDCRNQKPSADTIQEIDGGPPVIAWTYVGNSEVADVIQIPAEGIHITWSGVGPSAYYKHDLRILSESFAVLNMVHSLGSTAVPAILAWGGWIFDGSYQVGWSTTFVSSTTYNIVLVTGSGAVAGAVSFLATEDVYYDVELRKYGTDSVELWVDGKLIDRKPYSVFSVSTALRSLFIGVASASSAVDGRIRQAGWYCETQKDYWGLREATARVFAANPQQINSLAGGFVSGDVGKQIRLSLADQAHGKGGNANGRYLITNYVSAFLVDIEGVPQENAQVQSGLLYVTVDAKSERFTYPEDQGKELVISGSAVGNDDTYIIDKIIDDVSMAEFDDWKTPLVQKSTICKIVDPGSGFAFVAETGLAWRKDPDFVDDSGLQSDLSDAASEAAGVITLRDALPAVEPVEVSYSEVLSAQILLDFTKNNVMIQVTPEQWEYYPFYLSDPLGFIRAYLDDLTAAGVIPEYTVE